MYFFPYLRTTDCETLRPYRVFREQVCRYLPTRMYRVTQQYWPYWTVNVHRLAFDLATTLMDTDMTGLPTNGW